MPTSSNVRNIEVISIIGEGKNRDSAKNGTFMRLGFMFIKKNRLMYTWPVKITGRITAMIYAFLCKNPILQDNG